LDFFGFFWIFLDFFCEKLYFLKKIASMEGLPRFDE
jgi:hypothetical protein